MSMIPALIPYAEKMKMKVFSGIFPSLVKQYHEESFFDVKLYPSDLQYLIDPKDPNYSYDILVSDQGIKGKFLFTFDILIGDKVVRKLLTAVHFTLKLTLSPYVPDELDLKFSLSLGKLDSFDPYQRPIPKESSSSEIPLISKFSQYSYKLPFNPSCYGF